MRLRVGVLDAALTKKGITSVAELSRKTGISRSNLFRLRAGEIEPLLSAAFEIAAAAGTTVEKIFERRAA